LISSYRTSSIGKNSTSHAFGSKERLPLDIAIFGKLGNPMEVLNRTSSWTNEIIKLKNEGTVIIIDYTDHHLSIASNMTKFYIDNIIYTDIITVPSPKMIENLQSFVSSNIILVDDAIEFSFIPPILKYNSIIEVLWFGAKSNLKFLLSFLEQLNYGNKQLNINLLTDIKGLEWLSALDLKSFINKNIKINPFIWSINNMIEISKKCDFCIIPSNPNDLRKSGAGTNRLMTSFALGLPVLASCLSSYKPYSEYFRDIQKCNIYDFVDDLENMYIVVANAQNKILQQFTNEFIGATWCNIIDNALRIKR